MEPAEILVCDSDIDIVPGPILRERYFGPLEGKTTDQIGKKRFHNGDCFRR